VEKTRRGGVRYHRKENKVFHGESEVKTSGTLTHIPRADMITVERIKVREGKKRGKGQPCDPMQFGKTREKPAERQ